MRCNWRLTSLVRLLLAGLMLPLTSGCDSAGVDPVPASPRYVAESDYTVTLDGLKLYDFVVGTGNRPIAGQRISAHYTGWLEDGTRFDSSRDGEPFSYIFGLGQVIPGWDEGVNGMQVGGDRQIVIPPKLAYGERGSGPVPPNATLTFEIELIAIE